METVKSYPFESLSSIFLITKYILSNVIYEQKNAGVYSDIHEHKVLYAVTVKVN